MTKVVRYEVTWIVPGQKAITITPLFRTKSGARRRIADMRSQWKGYGNITRVEVDAS